VLIYFPSFPPLAPTSTTQNLTPPAPPTNQTCQPTVFTFYKARGLAVGGSLVEDDKLDLARELEAKAKAKGVELILPTDVVVADKFAPDAKTQTVSVEAIPDGWMGLDQVRGGGLCVDSLSLVCHRSCAF
jgi:hypothetical protein